jgi:hypothetical protein
MEEEPEEENEDPQETFTDECNHTPSINYKKAINDTAILQNLNLTKTNSFQTHTNRQAILQLQPTNLAVHNLCNYTTTKWHEESTGIRIKILYLSPHITY